MGGRKYMIGVTSGKSVIRKRRMLLAWMLVFGLFIFAGCGGQSGESAAAADVENQTSPEKAADMDGQDYA